MKFGFHPEARIELNKAIDDYEERREDLGWEFFEEVQSTIQRVLEFPNAWSSLSTSIRRCLTNRFPYGVIYQIKSDEVWIVAIAHQRSKPDYWKDRLAESY